MGAATLRSSNEPRPSIDGQFAQGWPRSECSRLIAEERQRGSKVRERVERVDSMSARVRRGSRIVRSRCRPP